MRWCNHVKDTAEGFQTVLSCRFAFSGFNMGQLLPGTGSPLKDFSFREAVTRNERAKSWVSWGCSRCLCSCPHSKSPVNWGLPHFPQNLLTSLIMIIITQTARAVELMSFKFLGEKKGSMTWLAKWVMEPGPTASWSHTRSEGEGCYSWHQSPVKSSCSVCSALLYLLQ